MKPPVDLLLTYDFPPMGGGIARWMAADNVKRIVRGSVEDQSPWEIAGFLELKTVWHPMGV